VPTEKTFQIQGPFRVEASSDITLVSSGRGITLSAPGRTGEMGHVSLQAGNTIKLDCGPAFVMLRADDKDGSVVVNGGPQGSLIQMAGDTDKGPKVILDKDLIHLCVGPVGTGTSISLSADGILFKVGNTSVSLTSSGIEESVNLVFTRKLSVTGHEMKAAESEFKVDVVGVSADGVMLKQTAQGVVKLEAPLATSSIDGMGQDKYGMHEHK
jgi:hypothetical protein